MTDQANPPATGFWSQRASLAPRLSLGADEGGDA
jgi:hypothetical protein